MICPEKNESFTNFELKLESKFDSKGGVLLVLIQYNFTLW